MKKWVKVLLWFSPLILVLGFCGGVILFGTCPLHYKLAPQEASNWMSNLDENKKLVETIIPGSHDSCTYKMNWLGNTQYETISQQLASGCRYFDIRVNKVSENEYKIYHGPILGVDFDPVIDSIANFISNHTSETLILDFQHFENGAQEYVLEKVNEKLLPYALHNNSGYSDLEFIDNVKIKDVRGKCVILFGYGSHKDLDYIFERNNDECLKTGCSLDSCYYTERNGASSKEFIDSSIPFYISQIQNKIANEGHKGLFVLQGQLTDNALIFGPWSKEASHDRRMSKFISGLPRKNYFSLINIIMRDFVNYDKMSQIYKLNFLN